ncbi:MAG: hypothetical protein ACRDP6_32050 [Actinoallomurus sp.]
MSWTIDESRVKPFLSAAERRDVTALLWGAPRVGLLFPEQESDEAAAENHPPAGAKRTKDGKDFKDGKDGKEFKEQKDTKDTKDFKDGKDTKDSKDSKDSKDFKDGKDSFDGAMAPSDAVMFVRPDESAPSRPSDLPRWDRVESGTIEPDEAYAVLRGSRINRLLRRRGVVI